jgi:hypothetical protein
VSIGSDFLLILFTPYDYVYSMIGAQSHITLSPISSFFQPQSPSNPANLKRTVHRPCEEGFAFSSDIAAGSMAFLELLQSCP